VHDGQEYSTKETAIQAANRQGDWPGTLGNPPELPEQGRVLPPAGTNGWKGEWKDGRMEGWKGGWVEERMGEGMEEWVGGEGARTFCPSSIHPSNPLARPLAATQEGNSGWAHLIGSSGSTVDPMRAVSEWRTSWEGEAPAEPPGSQQRLSRSFALPHPPQGAILKQPLGLVLPARGATSPRHRRRKQTQEAWLCFLVCPTRVSLGPTCAQDAPRTRTKTLSILSRRRHGRPAHQSEPPRAIGPLRS